jgi:tetratricopeptide (TPR) repeat protein
MSEKQNNSGLDIDATILETTHKVESFYHKNKKTINNTIFAVLGIIVAYFVFNEYYLKPKEKEAQVAIFPAQAWFEIDSFDLALNGKGDKAGFLTVISDYGMTKTANLAHYYAGICYLQKGEFDMAIEQLEDFDTDNKVLGPLAMGLLGDAYSEKNELNKAVKNYLKAASFSSNKLTTPIFLKKAAYVYEENKEWSDALNLYEKIKKEYPDAQEASDIDKYIARAKAMSENS